MAGSSPSCRWATLTGRPWAGCVCRCRVVECRAPRGVSGEFDYGKKMRNRVRFVLDAVGELRKDVREVRERFCGPETCLLYEEKIEEK